MMAGAVLGLFIYRPEIKLDAVTAFIDTIPIPKVLLL